MQEDQFLSDFARTYGSTRAERVAVFLNPYLSAYQESLARLKQGYETYGDRRPLVRIYGFAIPNQAAIDTIAKYGPVVEMGAGTGYWAWLLRRAGVDVLAYDKYPVEGGANSYFKTETHTTVLEGDEDQLTELALYGDKRSLLLCWPPYDNNMAAKTLSLFEGSVFVYVGESCGGCTADDAFFQQLEADWFEVERVDIPQWEGIHDYLWVYRRKFSR